MTDVFNTYETKHDTPSPVSSPTSPPLHPIIITSVPDATSPAEQNTSPTSTASTRSSLPPIPTPITNGSSPLKTPTDLQPVAGPSSSDSTLQTSPSPSPSPVHSPLTASRKTSTFRRVPLRNPSARPTLPSSPLRPQSMISSRTTSGVSVSSRTLGPSQNRTPEPSIRSMRSPQLHTAASVADKGPLPPIPALELPEAQVVSTTLVRAPESAPPAPYRRKNSSTPTPTPHSSSLAIPQVHQRATSPTSPGSSVAASPSAISPSPISSTSSLPTPTSQRASTPSRTYASYRPGFQPKGVYRPRTDEFLEMRRTRSDVGRVERTRLERRLEKLINLHFPHPDKQKQKEGGGEGQMANGRPAMTGTLNRRASSFFDVDIASLKGKSAGDLWRGVVQAQVAGSKADIRAAEQTIAPWQDDADVSQCPLCTASFHPLTNRKHHCRLCGRIICSLPIKYPLRPQQCSLLFVADPLTGQIEEVGEGVDYGVRRRTRSVGQGGGKGKGRDDLNSLTPEEKFLKGVRICRECKPVLLRKQYIQDSHKVPLFTRLYEAFVSLEKEIEDALPHFQELMVSLSQDERPSLEASAARKRLLEAFAQYDALAKRMRKLPCPGGSGSSQDRVQQAIITRANNFLQKNMFPLQALPNTSKKKAAPSTPSGEQDSSGPIIDPDSEVARVLQPLLEQEALLESFVEEAKTHRKFEDAQTLKANLSEIRAEIDRILANAA
ncbi:FYVE zinc finger-domain-containing protein [Cytidiella melzeri]|nr:FYVE zinc finger-domain-containing protein [Cytidiella melzeri]